MNKKLQSRTGALLLIFFIANYSFAGTVPDTRQTPRMVKKYGIDENGRSFEYTVPASGETAPDITAASSRYVSPKTAKRYGIDQNGRSFEYEESPAPSLPAAEAVTPVPSRQAVPAASRAVRVVTAAPAATAPQAPARRVAPPAVPAAARVIPPQVPKATVATPVRQPVPVTPQPSRVARVAPVKSGIPAGTAAPVPVPVAAKAAAPRPAPSATVTAPVAKAAPVTTQAVRRTVAVPALVTSVAPSASSSPVASQLRDRQEMRKESAERAAVMAVSVTREALAATPVASRKQAAVATGAKAPTQRSESASAQKAPARTASLKKGGRGQGKFVVMVADQRVPRANGTLEHDLKKLGARTVKSTVERQERTAHRLVFARHLDRSRAISDVSMLERQDQRAYIIAGKGTYTVLCGSYYGEARAQAELQAICNRGLRVTMQKDPVVLKKKILMAGGFESRGAAVRLASALKQRGIRSTVMTAEKYYALVNGVDDNRG